MRNGDSRLLRCLALVAVTGSTLVGHRLLAQDSSQNPDDRVYEVRKAGDYGVKPPKAIYSPNPEYSEKARRKKIQGVVVLGVVVNPDGTVRDATVVQSLEPGLDKQALAAVSKWKFQPATKDGKPVAVHVMVETNFRLY